MARNNLDSPKKLKSKVKVIMEQLDLDLITPRKAEVLFKGINTQKDIIKTMELEDQVEQLRGIISEIEEREKVRKQSGMY